MSKGILIFAYNSKLDYVSIATVAARLAKKYIGLPVAVVTDEAGADKIDSSIFDIRIIENLSGPSSRRMFKYSGGDKDLTEWHNTNRSNAYYLSPFDQTLLIDADYLMFNDSLKKLFDTNLEFACYDKVHEISGWNGLENTARVGFPGIPMQWATVVYFTKNDLAESIFSFMQIIKENYFYYSTIYNFTTELFRNDYTLSIALQTLTGYNRANFTAIPGSLISANTGIDLIDVRRNTELVFTWRNKNGPAGVNKIKNTNVHIMNKRTIADPVVLEKLMSIA